MNPTLLITLIVVALVLWLTSFVVRRKSYKIGVILSWSATGIALLALILKFFL